MGLLPRIPRTVARKLGYYVYIYVNPLNGSIFYVGKGKGQRALAHLDAGERRKISKILRGIKGAGQEPRIEILTHGLRSEEAAFAVERAVIDALGFAGLTNVVRGWKGAEYGRMPLKELVAHYTRKRANIREPALLIRINRVHHYGMTEVQLYDATRSAWVVGERRHQAEYALAVYEGVVREVYKISQWLRAGSTFNDRWEGRGFKRKGRWEFVGVVADDKIRKRYVNKYVGHLFTQGAQNPITYINV